MEVSIVCNRSAQLESASISNISKLFCQELQYLVHLLAESIGVTVFFVYLDLTLLAVASKRDFPKNLVL